MAAAAHTPGGYDGVPQTVGREFNQADKGTGILRASHRGKATMAGRTQSRKPRYDRG